MHRAGRSSLATVLCLGISVGTNVVACYHESDVAPRQDSATDTDIGETLGDDGPSSGAPSDGSDSETAPTTDESSDASGGLECMLDAECPDDNDCTLDVCDNHLCKNVALDGVPVVEQVTGDCSLTMCVAGAPQQVADPEDLPDDDNDCTLDGCDGTAEDHVPDVLGAPCNDGGSCDGAGICLECLSPDDCDHLPVDDECATRTCDAGVCGQIFTEAGTLANATLQTAGDCLRVVCDGAGATTSEPNYSDPYVDGLECTQDNCSDGDPVNPPRPAGTPCAAGECNDAGQCTGCNEADDCGEPNACQAPTCNAQGVCGVVDTAAGSALPGAEQTDGDCQELQCDGSGAIASYADDDDVPDDDGNDCTDESCSDGFPQHPDEPVGTPCNDDGGAYCDGSGACVECVDAGDCAPADGCSVAACEDNQCVVEPADAGTPCSDNLFCTATDTCNAAGVCVGTLNPCPGADGDGDCSESCDESANACTGNDASGTACNDGLYCTSTDACNAMGVCAGTGSPCPGADGDADCTESCNEADDACTADDTAGSPCDDGLHCTTADACTAGSCGGTEVSCVDPQACFESCMGCGDDDCGA